MREVADWVAANYRLPVTYVSGPIFITNRRGEQVRVRGVYTGSGIILQADHSRDTITSLARHEVFHDEAARDAGLVEEIRERIIEEYGEDELRNIVHGYIVALRGTAAAGVSENASDAEIDAAAHEILEEIFADANGGMNAFGYGAHKYESIVNEVRSERAATRGSQANGERETRGPPSQPYSIDEGFADAVQTWYDETKPEQRMSSPGYFHVGTTSDALAGIGARTDNIYMRKYKIGTILDDHPEMSIDEIKKLPEILEHPVLVMKSLTHPDSIVVFGELKAKNGDNVMASVELTPTPGGNTEAEFSLITSAYARTRENIQKLIQNSELLYLDPNKKRTNNWLMQLRVQFPSRQPPFGSIGTISYADDGVNIQGKTLKELGVEMTIAADLDTAKEKISEIPEEQKSPMQKAMEEALRRRAGTEEKYSYAGEEAETADVARLRDAEQMEKDGRSSEEIRQNTGWFRGTAGKWRFEISDRDAVFHRNGDARFLKDHPEYARYLELTEKFLNGAVTAEEMEAILSPEVWVRVSAEATPAEGGTVTISPEAEVYKKNTTVTLTATPAEGYRFVGWMGADTTILSEDVTYKYKVGLEDMAFRAVFSVINAVSPAAATTLKVWSEDNVLYLDNIENGTEIALFDLTGRCVNRSRATAPSHTVAGLSAGLYLMQTTTADTRRQTMKVTVKK